MAAVGVPGVTKVHEPGRRARRDGMPEHNAPPRLVDPILSAWEAFDSRRRRIRPLTPDGILGVETARLRHSVAVDGAVLPAGARIAEIHLLNARVRELESRAGLAAAFRQVRADLGALAAEQARLPDRDRLAACHGAGIMAHFARREGWEIHPRRLTPWQRVEDWYFRWLLVHWTPTGRERLRHGRRPLRSVDAWLTGPGLQARYGGGAGTRRGAPAAPRVAADDVRREPPGA